jgi:tetratricopeptide (TPR) repeat protein
VASPASPSRALAAATRWLLWLAPLVLAGLFGAGRLGYAYRVGPRRHFEAAVAAFARNDLDAVQTAAEALRGVAGYEPHSHLLEGMLLLRKDRLPDAAVQLGLAANHPDTRALACTLCGEALCRSRELRGAERVLKAAIQSDRSQTDAHRWLAVLYYDIGSMVHALKELSAVAEQAPGDPRPLRLMGLIHKDFDKYQEAATAYRESLRRAAALSDEEAARFVDKTEIRLELGECLLRLRRHAELLEALGECPRSAQRLALEAASYYNERDIESARKLVAAALALAPNELDALHLQATLDLDANDPAAAVKILRRAAEQYPKDHSVHYKLSQAYQRLGRKEAAAAEAKLSKELYDLQRHFAELHQQAIRDTADADVRYQLGVVARQLGKPELAETWFRAALALDPRHAGAHNELEVTPPLPGLPPQPPPKKP